MRLSKGFQGFLLASLLLGQLASLSGYAQDTQLTGLTGHLNAYTQGVQAYHAGQYEAAAQAFRRVLKTDATNSNAHYYLGLSLDQLNRATEAAPEYQYVAGHGQEATIVAYAQSRYEVLTGHSLPMAPTPVAQTAQNSSPGPEVAMIAASQTAPTIYRAAASQIAVPLKSNKNALMVDAMLQTGQNQAIGTFIIDTGATYTSISQEMAEKLGLDLVNCEKVHITTANGRIEVPKVVLETLNVNGLEAHNVEATVIQVRQGSSFHGLLGLSFIRQFVLTIDPQANQLIFQKN